jgi:Peptidase_C39 like family
LPLSTDRCQVAFQELLFMAFMLVALLIFALLVTMAGFFLSFKPQARDAGALYARTRVRRRYPDTEPVSNPRFRQPATTQTIRFRSPATTQAIPRPARAMTISSPGPGLSLGRRGAGERIHWSVVVIGLVSVFILGLFAFNAVFPRSAILMPTWFADTAQPTAQASPPPTFYGASKALQRLSQLDPAQYNSTQDYITWAYSACSTAAMTEVFNAYGRHYRIADVLKVEASIKEITPALGLVEDVGIQRTATLFGFKTSWGYSLSLDKIIAIANSGEPVIVSWPPSKYAGGHLVVIIGGNNATVYLADSSRYDRTSLSHAQFLKWWGGFSAVVTPG